MIIYSPWFASQTRVFFNMNVSIFIDGNNFYFGLRKIYGNEKDLSLFNFQKFCNLLSKEREIQNIFYYNAPLDITKNLEKYKNQQRFFDKIGRIPKFNLVLCKMLKRKIKKTNYFYYVIKEDDIHMAVDMVEGASDDKYDIAILVSGDGDFVPAVKAVQRKNKLVENAYFRKTSSSNLKQNCDKSIKLTREILDQCFDIE